MLPIVDQREESSQSPRSSLKVQNKSSTVDLSKWAKEAGDKTWQKTGKNFTCQKSGAFS